MANIRVGSAVMVSKEGKLLLGKRGKEPDFGALIIPGGGVNLYENFEDTAKREIKEEAGIEIKNLRQFKTYQIITPEIEQHRVIIFWQADYSSGDVVSSDDLLSAKFYTKDEIKKEYENGKMTGIIGRVLKDAGWL